MMEAENRELLVEGAKAFGIDVDDSTVDRFDRYLKELLKWNQKINLTAVRTEKGIILKHFLDSLSVYPFLSDLHFLLDLGSGAGFPGIPLKMIKAAFEVTLLDSVLKKVDFQRHVIRVLGLQGIRGIHGRAQGKEVLEIMGGRFDTVVSRAFSDLQTFLLLSYPFLKRGGIAVAMKGQVTEEEIRDPAKVNPSWYTLRETSSFSLPFSSFKRSILIFEKE